jgi:hypothetical protein
MLSSRPVEEANVTRDNLPAPHLASVALPLIRAELALHVDPLPLDKVLSAALA